MSKITKYTPIKSATDAKGLTIYTSVTFADGSKKRLRKRVKADEAEDVILYWQDMLGKGFDPTNENDENAYLKIDEKITFAHAYDEFIEFHNYEPKTHYNINNRLQPLLNEFGSVELEKITTLDIERVWRSKISNGDWSQATYKNAKTVTSVFYNFCVRAKYVNENPVSYVTKALRSDKRTAKRYIPFADDHFTAIMEAVKQSTNKRLYLYCCMIYHAMLRPKELRLLKKEDIDFNSNTITVHSDVAKNGKTQTIPLYNALKKVLLDYEVDKLEPKADIFPKKAEKHFTNPFNQILRALGLKEDTGYSIYGFKHTSNKHKVTGQFGVAFTPAQLSKLNRHSDINTTLIYLKNLTATTDIDGLDSIDI